MSSLSRCIHGVFGILILPILALAQEARLKIPSPAATVPMKTFTDQASGVSFMYPAA